MTVAERLRRGIKPEPWVTRPPHNPEAVVINDPRIAYGNQRAA